jgi:uncharacterized protein (DUF305 family)
MLKRSILRLAVVCALAAAAACAQSDHHAMHHGAPGSDPFARAMDAGMEKMMRDMHAAGSTGNPDVDFLAMMIPHHEGAVEMARLELVYGRDPLTRRLGEEIIASQTAEIAAMKNRLAILRRGEDPNPGGFPALDGTRGGGK